MKKLFLALLSLVLVISLLPMSDIATAYAVEQGISAINEAIEQNSAEEDGETEPTFTKYELPTDDASIEGYNAQGGVYFNNSATTNFKLGALDVGTTTLDKAYPDFHHIAFKGVRDPEWNTLNICTWSRTNVIFQQGEDFSGKGFSKNAFTMWYKVESASHKYVPVIAFIAPADGNYEFNVSFCKRYNIDNITTEFYLVKSVLNGNYPYVDIANGVIDKYTWEYDTENYQQSNNEHAYTSANNQTLEGTVKLKAGEEVWFLAAPKDYEGSNNNQTIVNSFVVTQKDGTAGGSGSEDTDFDFTGYTEISTKEELNAVRNDLAGKYVLTADIEFTEADFAEGGAFYNGGAGWTPIGTAETPFTGTFDGNGHTIKGLKVNIESDYDIYAGLFGYVNGGTVRNVGMIDSNIKAGEYYNAYVGGIVGYLVGGFIEGCYNTGDITTSSSSYESRSYAGGIVGYLVGGVIEGCYNTGDITASSFYESNSYAGGIAGYDDGYTAIRNCHNTGSVTGDSTYAGGIAGNLDNSTTITSCYNTGSVTGNLAGGIVGYVYGGSITISNCYNTGSVTGNLAGGIAGILNNSTTITSCYNTGSVTGDSTYAGGIAGYVCGSSTTISNCYNTGSVTGDYNVGGIAGYVNGYYGSSAISNCYNTGSVTATSTSSTANAGGIAGYLDNSTITSCYNTGSVTGDYNVGGIVGYLSSGTITDCYYINNIDKGVGNGIDKTVSCTPEQMELQATFAGFDFDTVWTMDGNAEYPMPELRDVEMQFEKELSYIGVTTLPTKTEYIEKKEALDVAGGKLTLYFSDLTSEVIDLTSDMISGFDNTFVGTLTLTVTYGGKTATFEVEIIEDPALLPAVFSQVSLTLNGDIGVNFYFTLHESVIADSEAYFFVTLPSGETSKIMVSEAGKGSPIGSTEEFYKITANVAAKEMSDKIKVEVYTKDGLAATFEYSVIQYARLVLNDSSADAELVAMIKAMLNYGAESQELFDYNTSSPANADLDNKTASSVDASLLAGATTEGTVSGFNYLMFSCVLETKTTLRQYFALSEDASSYTFKLDGITVTPVMTTLNGQVVYYIDITDIAANEMGTVHTLTVTKGAETRTVKCSVHSYMKVVVNANDNPELVRTVNAMYEYNKTAVAYFG